MEGLPSADDLFRLSTKKGNIETVVMIPIENISNFPNHPFKVKDDEKMMETVASIKNNGVLIPAIIRPKENGKYEMVSGHRRKRACEIANKIEMPCIIRNLNDDEATILMVDSNVQREEILPSERAFAYKMKLEALKHQGKRVDLTSTPVGEKLSIDIIAEECEINKSDNIIIYGHHIRGRKMFGDLESYKSKNFYEENKIIDFYTLNDNTTEKKQYEIFSVFKTPVYTSNEFKYYNYINFNSEEEFSEFINKCKSKAMYDTNINPKYKDKMITLSTCEYSQRNGRLVVIAKEI